MTKVSSEEQRREKPMAARKHEEEKDHIIKVYLKTKGSSKDGHNMAEAARKLKINPNTLRGKLQQWKVIPRSPSHRHDLDKKLTRMNRDRRLYKAAQGKAPDAQRLLAERVAQRQALVAELTKLNDDIAFVSRAMHMARTMIEHKQVLDAELERLDADIASLERLQELLSATGNTKLTQS